ncbi:MAG: ABC transporter permease [Treponema sp.]|jgi:phospholipid/cholesterol/gamma-HCH transport system permease protein|nr:ABC transporter permease [Treponema sp.]
MKGTENLLWQRIRNKLEEGGRYFVFLGTIGRCSLKGPVRFSRCLAEIEHLGVNSVLIILLSGGAIGMIFALQMVALLQPFQAEIGTGAAVAVALSREMAPVITTLMLIAKNGSAMAAELGTMRVTEQIDALESMAISPVQYLVVPKVIASFLVFPLLTLLANLVGVLGAYMVSIYLFDIDGASYMDYMFNFLSPRDVFVGLIKAWVMGFIVATLCCFYGLHAAPGAKGVGDSATNAVVASSTAILVADYLLTTIMLRFIYA